MENEERQQALSRHPDFIVMASEIPAHKDDPKMRPTRVGAAWQHENGNISITLDNFVKLEGKPYAYISIFLTPNKFRNGSA